MNTRSPEEIVTEHGITVDDARDIVALYFHETWPRIRFAMRLHKLDHPKHGISSRIRVVPWPHVQAYNALVGRICTARTKAELRPEILRAKEQIIRRLIVNSSIFAMFGHAELDAKLWPDDAVDRARRVTARERMASLLHAGDDAEPAGQWLAELGLAMTRDMPLVLKRIGIL